jgi:hypothetical protein
MTTYTFAILFTIGLFWIWGLVERHPLVQRWRYLRGTEHYWRSAIDELPSYWEMVRPHLIWFFVAAVWTMAFLMMPTMPGGNFMFFFGLIAFVAGGLRLGMDLAARRHRALELSSGGITYLEDEFDAIKWEEIVVILDYEQAIIIKTPDDIYEFTFETDPADYHRFLEEVEAARGRLSLPVPYRKV